MPCRLVIFFFFFLLNHHSVFISLKADYLSKLSARSAVLPSSALDRKRPAQFMTLSNGQQVLLAQHLIRSSALIAGNPVISAGGLNYTVLHVDDPQRSFDLSFSVCLTVAISLFLRFAFSSSPAARSLAWIVQSLSRSCYCYLRGYPRPCSKRACEPKIPRAWRRTRRRGNYSWNTA